MFSNTKKMAFFYIIAIFFIALDRLFKTFFYLNKDAIYRLGDNIAFLYTENKYIAFSIPVNEIFIKYTALILTLLIIIAFIYYTIKHNQLLAYPLFIMILGSFSNIYDRFKLGFVIDYAYIKNFTVFNIADSMIFIGVAILTFYIYSIDKSNKI